MIIGNQEWKNRLQKYLEQHAAAVSGQASFFLLYGPANVGKAAIALELSQSYLWSFTQSWLLHIKDFSSILGKNHSIRVEEKKDNEEYDILYKEHRYQNFWVREINNWLHQSSFGWSKILLIENIERMTPQATNAFLKTCEEPLPNRVIIATTSNKVEIFETIISRAISIAFFPLSNQEMEQYIIEKGIKFTSPEVRQLLIEMAMWKPWTLENFVNHLIKDENWEKNMQKLIKILPQPWKIVEKYKILEKLKEQWILEQFLDWWIAYCTNHHIGHANNRLKVKKLFQGNVKKENIILYGLLW